MTVKIGKFNYTLTGKNAPFNVNKFDAKGRFVEKVGEVSEVSEDAVNVLLKSKSKRRKK